MLSYALREQSYCSTGHMHVCFTHSRACQSSSHHQRVFVLWNAVEWELRHVSEVVKVHGNGMHTTCSHAGKQQQRAELFRMGLRQYAGTGRTQGMVLRLGCSALTMVNSPILVRTPFLPARSVQPLGSMAKMPAWMLGVTQLSRQKSACTAGALRHVCILHDFALTSRYDHTVCK